MNTSVITLIGKEIANSNEAILNDRETAHLVHFMLKGSAVVKKGNDYEQMINFSLPWEKMCAVLFSKLNGVTVESVVKEALEADLSTTEIKAQAKEAIKSFKNLGMKDCTGKVSIKDAVFTETSIEIQ